jgi:hypothetical protein
MKFRYTRLLAASLTAAILIILVFSVTLQSIDPMTLARSQNGEITRYLTEARKVALDRGNNTKSATLPNMAKSIDEYLAAAQVVANDQKKILDQIVEKRSSFDITSSANVFAAVVAVAGTFSSIVLSWRKDVREAKAELEKLKAQAPKIEIP